MYFCFFCGGELPESRRSELYTQPAPEELNEIKELLGRVHTTDDLIADLGPPDKEAATPVEETDEAKHHYFSKRWKSLDLIVRGKSDNTFEVAVVGKFKETKGRSKGQKK